MIRVIFSIFTAQFENEYNICSIFSYNIFWLCFFPSLISPAHFPTYPQLYVFFFLKNKKQVTKAKAPEPTKTKIKTIKRPMRQNENDEAKGSRKFTNTPLNLCCVGLLGMGPALEMWLIYPVWLHRRKQICLSQWVSIAGSFLVRGETQCPLHTFSPSACICCHSLRPVVFRRQFPWCHSSPQALKISLSSVWRGLIMTPHSGLGASEPLS